jgi:hypothetical protein
MVCAADRNALGFKLESQGMRLPVLQQSHRLQKFSTGTMCVGLSVGGLTTAD